jgi:hypothetical protein
MMLGLTELTWLTQERLVCSSTTGDDADHSTYAALENLLRTAWKLDTGLAYYVVSVIVS